VRAVYPPDQALAIATKIARMAGGVLAEGFANGPARVLGMRHAASTKDAAYDLVTEYDRRSEALLVEQLGNAFPGDAIIAEEGGGRTGTSVRWYVDPLDGTTNFAHGLPMFAIAIGRVVGDKADVGVVHAPILDLTFTASRGGGAFCNGKRLAVSTETSLARAMLATGFPSDRSTSADNNFSQFVTIKSRVQAIRRLGSSTLDQAFVAAGTFDGFWEMKLKAWDLAAGSLLVEEAGGKATGWLGEQLRLERGAVVATNGRIHADVLAHLAKSGIPEVVR
jgi:myo-inositol-1(or 4)-monophosphatase